MSAIAEEGRARSFIPSGWLKRYALAVIGSAIVASWVLVAILGDYLTPDPFDQVDVTKRLLAPSAEHWLGTDILGRDVFSRLLIGSRISLLAGLSVVLIGGTFGALMGAVAAYAGGRMESWIMRATDLVMCFPPIILAMAIAAAREIGRAHV